MNNKTIGIAVVLTVVVAPLAAFIITNLSAAQNDQHILSAKAVSLGSVKRSLDKENATLPTDERLKNITVASLKRYESVWYIASVGYTTPDTGETQQSVALLGDLHGDPENPTVILNPEQVFPSVNISDGMGVPYDAIDTVNAFYANRDGKEK